METITVKILTIGEKNTNGLIYSKGMAESIIKSFQETGYIFGIRGSLENESGIPVTEATHIVNGISLVDGKHLVAEIKFLETPKGKEFKEFYHKNKEDIVFKAEGTGQVDRSSNLIYDYNVTGVNALLKSEIEQKNKKRK